MTYFKRIFFTFLLFPIVVFSQHIKEDPKLISGELNNGLKYYLYQTDENNTDCAYLDACEHNFLLCAYGPITIPQSSVL